MAVLRAMFGRHPIFVIIWALCTLSFIVLCSIRLLSPYHGEYPVNPVIHYKPGEATLKIHRVLPSIVLKEGAADVDKFCTRLENSGSLIPGVCDLRLYRDEITNSSIVFKDYLAYGFLNGSNFIRPEGDSREGINVDHRIFYANHPSNLPNNSLEAVPKLPRTIKKTLKVVMLSEWKVADQVMEGPEVAYLAATLISQVNKIFKATPNPSIELKLMKFSPEIIGSTMGIRHAMLNKLNDTETIEDYLGGANPDLVVDLHGEDAQNNEHFLEEVKNQRCADIPLINIRTSMKNGDNPVYTLAASIVRLLGASESAPLHWPSGCLTEKAVNEIYASSVLSNSRCALEKNMKKINEKYVESLKTSKPHVLSSLENKEYEDAKKCLYIYEKTKQISQGEIKAIKRTVDYQKCEMRCRFYFQKGSMTMLSQVLESCDPAQMYLKDHGLDDIAVLDEDHILLKAVKN